MKLKFLIIILLLLSSCTNNLKLPNNYDIQLIPKKNTTQTFEDVNISYILPKTSIPSSQGIHGLIFSNRCWGTETKQERLINNFSDGILRIERRTDNGVAGSGKRYTINASEKTINSSKILVTFNPKDVNTYQEGLILPFPLPDFDLEAYLANAQYNYSLELNSPYTVNSIEGNFNRILGSNHSYQVKLNNAYIDFQVKIYPYQSGSKIMIKAQLSNMKKIGDKIDVSNAITEFRHYIDNIVNN